MKRIALIVLSLLTLAGILSAPSFAANESFVGTYSKEASFAAVRAGTGVSVQWTKKNGDISYRLIVGQIVMPTDKISPKLTASYTEKIDFPNNVGKLAYSVYFNQNTTKNDISASQNWIFSEKFTSIRDEDQVAVLITTGTAGKTFSPSFFNTRDGGIYGRGLKFWCNVSAWGEPIARGTLSASNISLAALSYLPGPAGKAAAVGSQVVGKVSLATSTTLLGAEEVVRGEINYQVDATKADPNKLKAGGTIQLRLQNGAVRNATIRAISGAGKATNLVLDVTVNVLEAKSLFETIKTASASASGALETCRSLN